MNPACAIVVGLMVNRHQFEQLSYGEEPTPYAAGKAVATRYGAALADVGRALVGESLKRDGLTWDRYRDCHPSPEGCEFAARVVMNAIDSIYDPLRQPIAQQMPDPIDVFCYWRGRSLSFSEVNCGNGWNLSRPNWENVSGSKRDYFTHGVALWSEKTGAEAFFRFRGSALGVFLTAGPDAGDMEVSIDGSPFRRIAMRADYGELHYPYTQMLADELPEGEHIARIRVVQAMRGGKVSTAIRIHRLFVNDGGR